MNYIIDRRNTERYQIPGSQVLYKAGDGRVFLSPIKDLSYYSVCFEVENDFLRGETVDLRIIMPGKESISVKGNIVWSSFKSSENGSYATVQFLPFGTDEKYNSMETLYKLKELVNIYQQVIKTG